jgi:hypothetical protein
MALFVLSYGIRGCHLKTPPLVDNDHAEIKYVTITSEIFGI